MLLKFAYRNIWRRPFLNLVKILGLSLSLTGILLISLFLKQELSYDSFHSQASRTVRYTLTHPNMFAGKHFARIPNAGHVPDMVNELPGVEAFVRLAPVRGGMLKSGKNFLRAEQGFLCDSTFFSVFDVPLIVGNPEEVLAEPGSIVVSCDFAKRVFGSDAPIGQQLVLPKGQFYGEEKVYTISGVMAQFPQESHFHPEFVIFPSDKGMLTKWAWTYFVLTSTKEKVLGDISAYYASVQEDSEQEPYTPYLQPIEEIHLGSHKLREIEPGSSHTAVYTLSAAVLLLLAVALINFANLNKGMALFGEKFLSLARALGASRYLRKKYYFVEASIITLVSVVLSLLFAYYALIYIRQSTTLDIGYSDWGFVVAVIFAFLTLSILAGVLPMMKFDLVTFLQWNKKTENTMHMRKPVIRTLLIVQYALITILLFEVLVVTRQTQFALSKSIGVNSENIYCFENVHADVQQEFTQFKEELMRYPSIVSVSAMMEPPGGEANDLFPFKLEGYTPSDESAAANMIGVFPCDYSFPSVFKLSFIAGQDFSRGNKDEERGGEYIINRAALNRLGYIEPTEIIGKSFDLNFEYAPVPIPSGRIIGVVEDFHLSSIKKQVEPLVMFKRQKHWLMNFIVTVDEKASELAKENIHKVWHDLFPNYPLEYKQVAQMTEAVYKTEMLQAKLLGVFTIIALLCTIMGLLGISLLLAQRKTQEIGIRKVNGAATIQIMKRLNWHLIRWIFLAVLIAAPLAYWVARFWLLGFAYRIVLTVDLFVYASLTTIVLAIITISLSTWRIANMNPVKSLRYE